MFILPIERAALKLPKPFPGSLPRSPLSLVACQLRYSEPDRPVTAGRVANLRTTLSKSGYDYPKVDQIQIQSVTIDVNQPAAPTGTLTRGWRLVSKDSRWIVTVTPENVTLETMRYQAWSKDFRPRLHGLFQTFAKEFGPSVETRLGLRYVDLLADPLVSNAAGWRGLIADVLLGPVADDAIAVGVAVSQQQFTLAIDDSIRAVIRHGAYPDPSRDNAYTYLLDTDVFREVLLPYDQRDVEMATNRLHDVSVSLFRHFITDRLFQHLKKPAQNA